MNARELLTSRPGVLQMTEAGRARMTISCRDCESIPKVHNAGEIIERDGNRVQVMHNGNVVLADCYYGGWMTSIISSLHGHHEPQEEKVFHAVLDTLKPGASMIELGCFWAYYSLWFNTAIPNSRNICCEPDTRNIEVGKKNAELNNRDVIFLQAAAGNNHRATLDHRCEANGQILRIPIYSVDGILGDYGWDTLDVLHMDVQGAELSALQGATQAIEQGRITYVFVSTHHYSISGHPDTHQRCLDFLTARGGQIISHHTVAESFSGDGLIVARFGTGEPMTVDVSLNRAGQSLFRSPEQDVIYLFDVIDDRDAAELDGQFRNEESPDSESVMTDRDFVSHLYELCLGHSPNAEGLDAWCQYLASGGDQKRLLRDLLNSEGYRQRQDPAWNRRLAMVRSIEDPTQHTDLQYKAKVAEVPAICQSTIQQDQTHWFPAAMIGADEIRERLFEGDYITGATDLLTKLASDDFSVYLADYYHEGLSRFGRNWRYADILTVLLCLTDCLQPNSYLEIGVRRGRSVAAVASRRPECSLALFDLWVQGYAGMPNPGPDFVREELERIGHRGPLEILDGDSHETVPDYFERYPQATFDLITVDGDHSREGATSDLCNVLPHINLGGAIVFDDISHPLHPWMAEIWRDVVLCDDRFSGFSYTDAGFGVGFAIRKY